MIIIKADKTDKNKNSRWVIFITLVTFTASMFLSYLTSEISNRLSWYFAILVLLVIIAIGIIFDILGMAITTADEIPFHALASKKIRGAKQAINLLRNAEKMSNFCNDVIGDIAGIISGSTTAVIVVYIVNLLRLNNDMAVSMILTATTAALTIGGKAIGKSFAINNANEIVFIFAKIISTFNLKK